MRFNKRRTTHFVIAIVLLDRNTPSISKNGCATTTPNIQYAFMSIVLFRLILILLLYLLWMENAHITWLFSCYSIARFLFTACLIYIVCLSLALISSYFIVKNEFEIQTRIQNALLLLELGACAVVTRS